MKLLDALIGAEASVTMLTFTPTMNGISDVARILDPRLRMPTEGTFHTLPCLAQSILMEIGVLYHKIAVVHINVRQNFARTSPSFLAVLYILVCVDKGRFPRVCQRANGQALQVVYHSGSQP